MLDILFYQYQLLLYKLEYHHPFPDLQELLGHLEALKGELRGPTQPPTDSRRHRSAECAPLPGWVRSSGAGDKYASPAYAW